MKKYVLFFIACLYFAIGYTQVNWTKYGSNPVLTEGPDTFDIIAIGQPTVLFENDTIKMWYAAAGNDMKARICYAYSVDGIQWFKHDSPVIDVGNPGEWDCGWLDTPEIVRDASGYKMYFYGDTTQQFAAISSAIGMAYSADGIHWTKHLGNPIFTKGNPGEWDCSWVESPAVIYDDSSGEYKMWYNGIDTATWKIEIGLATSPDGINWTKDANNPVISSGYWGQYDDMWLGTPAVLHENGLYELWYSATSTTSYNAVTEKFDTVSICYATSADGVNWTKFAGNPLFNTYTTPFDSVTEAGGPWACDVVFIPGDNKYKMWYETFAGICFATSVITTSLPFISTLKSEDIILYPNPSNGNFNIILPEFPAMIRIINAEGKIISEMFSEKEKISIQSNLSPGIYFLEIETEKNAFSKKIVAQ